MSETKHRSLPYKPALDGLRAVAVLSVIFYHVGASWLPGGFLGVDVFFVLSGYLITSLLRLELIETGTIRLLSFWGRRFRRLVPALLAVLVAVLAYAFLIADPDELDRLATDGLATLFYVANWHFIALDASYFDQFEAPSPLLHTWSLAIEEQWYVVWPIIMIACAGWLRTRERRGAILFGLVAVASAAWMAFLYDPNVDPSRVYYGTDTRAQDLLVGSALAFWLGNPKSAPRPVPSWLGALCGSLVLAAFFVASDLASWTYRGGLLCFAVFTAGAIASAVQPESPLRSLLSAPWLRYIGKISYGMYLWHWPMLLFLGPERLGLDGLSLQLGCIVSTVAVSSASYHLLESPIRGGAIGGARIGAIGVTSVLMLACCFVAISPGAFSFDSASQSSESSTSSKDERKEIHVMVLGDSVAYTLARSYTEEVGFDRLSVANEAMMGCSVARGKLAYANVSNVPMGEECTRWPRAWRKAAERHEPDVVVILGGAWEVVDRVVGAVHYRTGTPQYARYITQSFELGLEVLAKNTPEIVMLTTPCFQQRWEKRTGMGDFPAPKKERSEPHRVKWFNQVLRNLAASHPDTVTLIDLQQLTCPSGEFPEPVDGIKLQPDGVHFSDAGGGIVWKWLGPQLIEIVERNRGGS